MSNDNILFSEYTLRIINEKSSKNLNFNVPNIYISQVFDGFESIEHTNMISSLISAFMVKNEHYDKEKLKNNFVLNEITRKNVGAIHFYLNKIDNENFSSSVSFSLISKEKSNINEVTLDNIAEIRGDGSFILKRSHNLLNKESSLLSGDYNAKIKLMYSDYVFDDEEYVYSCNVFWTKINKVFNLVVQNLNFLILDEKNLRNDESNLILQINLPIKNLKPSNILCNAFINGNVYMLNNLIISKNENEDDFIMLNIPISLIKIDEINKIMLDIKFLVN